MLSIIRQNFHEQCEAGLNKQINMELFAHYTYLSMAYYFNRDDVALKGFHKFFLKASTEEREHAMKLMEYQNLRGGHIVLADIQKPARHEWGSGLDAMQTALELEKEVNSSLIQLHKTAELHCDAQMQDFIESNFLKEQVEAINMLAGFISNLKRVGPGLGEYLFDKNSLGEDSSVH